MGSTIKHICREFLNNYFRIFCEFQKFILEILFRSYWYYSIHNTFSSLKRNFCWKFPLPTGKGILWGWNHYQLKNTIQGVAFGFLCHHDVIINFKQIFILTRLSVAL